MSARYLQVSHEIVRHPRLNGTAKALLQWALSLPPGTRETLQSLGLKMPEGRIAVSRARRQLIDEGYVHIRRCQSTETGTWTTAIMVSNTSLRTPEEIAAAWTATEDGGVRPDDRMLTVGRPGKRVVGTSPKGAKTRVNTSLPAAAERDSACGEPGLEPDPSPASAPGPEPAPGSAPAPTSTPAPTSAPTPEPYAGPDLGGPLGEAASALFRAAAAEPRLRLGVSEALKLAPLAAEWLARGVTERELRTVMVEGLPSRIHSPAALIRNRLVRKLPPAPAHLALPAPPPRPRTHDCTRCEAPGLPTPGVCRPCAGLEPPPEPLAAAIATRGAAAVRAAVGWARPVPQSL